MILLTFKENNSLRLGVKTDAGVIDVAAAGEAIGYDGAPHTMDELLAGEQPALDALTGLIEHARSEARAGWLRDEAELQIGPCVPNPGKIICVGLNYRQHAIESKMEIPDEPVLFSKFRNTVAAHGETIPLPSLAVEYDYEVELIAVIGRRAKFVSKDQALSYVFGYCNGNDLSARDLQRRSGQWLLGKTLDKFLPMGPYLVTADQVDDPQSLRVRCWLNGELRQDSTTADMIFSVAEIVSYVSSYMTLEPGDIISTGTPEGVILGHSDPVWLQPGDEVVVEAAGLGRLVNVMANGE